MSQLSTNETPVGYTIEDNEGPLTIDNRAVSHVCVKQDESPLFAAFVRQTTFSLVHFVPLYPGI